jgi:hypothetical protein
MDQRTEYDCPLILRNDESEDSEPGLTPIRNNWGKTYDRVYHDLEMGPVPSVEDLAVALAKIFSCIVQDNASREVPKSPFNAKKVPGIGLKDYFGRVAKYSRCSFETLVLAVIYIDRLHAARIDQFINAFNAHK